MRTLFLKIFLWFWVAVALLILGVAGVQTLSWWTGGVRLSDRNPFAMYAQLAADSWERDGANGLDRFLVELDRSSASTSWLLDQGGATLGLRDAAPAGAVKAAGRALASNAVLRLSTPAGVLIARPITGDHGRYVLVTRPRQSPPPILHRFRGNQWLLIAVTLLIAGLVCYALARYLTAPLVRLRTATRRLAEGDLGARVGGSRRRRDELADLGRDFDRMAERLEDAMTSQRRLLRDISHELRSPLARMTVALAIARQRGGTSDDTLDRIELEAERLNTLIGQLLTLSRFEAGEAAIERRRVALDDVVRAVCDNARFEAQGQGHAVRLVRCDPCTIEGQPDLLESAIENVVRNAMRYTPSGRDVEVALECGTVAVGGATLVLARDPAPGMAVVRVRDYGPGVPEDDLPRLFRPFHRVGEARDRQSGGVGLGLAITERAVRLHGGEVTARNAPGGGLVVELTLPVGTAANEPGDEARAGVS